MAQRSEVRRSGVAAVSRRGEQEHAGPVDNLMSYSREANPTTKTFARRFLVVAGLCVLLPPLAFVLPRQDRLSWPLIIGASAALAVIVAIGLADLRRMWRANGFTVPNTALVDVEIALGLLAMALFGFGAGADPAHLRLVMAVPVVIIASLGSRRMVVAIWIEAVVLLALGTWIAGGDGRDVVLAVVAFAPVWAVIAGTVFIVAQGAFGALGEARLLARIAEAGVGSESVADTAASIAPLAGQYLGGARVAIHRLRSDRPPALVAAWPSDGAGITPDQTLLAMARGDAGLTIVGDRGCVVASGVGAEEVSLTVELPARLRRDSWSGRYTLELLAVQVTGVMDRAMSVERLQLLSTTDPLTTLPNKRSLFEHLEMACRVASRRGAPLAVAMLDLDDFKRFNDTYGHLEGDELLRQFGLLLADRLRAGDIAARFGGEEFCLVLADVDGVGATSCVEGIRARLARVPLVHRATFSAGIASWNGQEQAGELLARADAALYEAKRRGKDCSVVDRPTALAEHDTSTGA